jgi:hypothetical protein
MLPAGRHPYVDLHAAVPEQAQHRAEHGSLVSPSSQPHELCFMCNRKVIKLKSVPGSKANNAAVVSYSGRLAFGLTQDVSILSYPFAILKPTIYFLGHWKRHLWRFDRRDAGKHQLVRVHGVSV